MTNREQYFFKYNNMNITNYIMVNALTEILKELILYYGHQLDEDDRNRTNLLPSLFR